MKKIISIIPAILMFSAEVSAVSGTVYRDMPVDGATANTYGVQDTNELGVEGVTVTVYPSGATTTTTALGTWGPIGPASGDVRVEFSNWPSYLEESAEAGAMNTSTQFVAATANNVDLGLHNSAQFCSVNPNAVTPRYINGDPALSTSPDETMVIYEYNDSGINSGSNIGNKVDTGSVWGVAFDSKRNSLYTSAVMKRHVGMGPSGAGAIYEITSPNGTPGVPSLLTTIPNIGSVDDNSTRGLTGVSPATPNHDPLSFPQVAKVGLGDIDISDDGNTLYAVNLNDKLIYTVDLDNPATPATLPAFPATSCTNGEARPWALKAHEGKVFLGVVCSAELAAGTAADLKSYVYSYNGSVWSTVISAFDLNYSRQKPASALSSPGEWSPWRDAVTDFNTLANNFGQPTPILSDIEFDSKGNMVLGFLDRSAMQFGALNYGTDTGSTTLYQVNVGGDILRATSNNDGTYTVEDIHNNAEFFKGDYYFGTTSSARHNETAYGGLALLSGSDQVMTVGMDPLMGNTTAGFNTGGVYWLNNTDGDKDRTLQLYKGRTTVAVKGFFGKAAGLGDIELLCDPAPVEIGNRVWLDTDGDGVQDPDETGIANVVVKLFDGATELASATTDASGDYIFSNDPNGTNTTSHIYNITSLVPDAGYTVRIENISGGSKQAALGVNELTTDNSGEAPNADLNDSDGVTNGLNADITVVASDIPTSGANNHSFDFGFGTVVPPQPSGLTLGNRLWFDNNNNGMDDSEPAVAGATVELINGSDRTTVLDTTTTDAEGHYIFTGLAAGNYIVAVKNTNFQTGGSLKGYMSTFTKESLPNHDGDLNDNGLSANEVADGVHSSIVTLVASSEPTGEPAGALGNGGVADADDNLTVDFGFVLATVSGADICDVTGSTPTDGIPNSVVDRNDLIWIYQNKGAVASPSAGAANSGDYNADGILSINDFGACRTHLD